MSVVEIRDEKTNRNRLVFLYSRLIVRKSETGRSFRLQPPMRHNVRGVHAMNPIFMMRLRLRCLLLPGTSRTYILISTDWITGNCLVSGYSAGHRSLVVGLAFPLSVSSLIRLWFVHPVAELLRLCPMNIGGRSVLPVARLGVVAMRGETLRTAAHHLNKLIGLVGIVVSAYMSGTGTNNLDRLHFFLLSNVS